MSRIYGQILRQAFSLAKGHRIFWSAGLFLVWPNAIRAVLLLGLVAAWFRVGGGQYVMQEQEISQGGNPWIGLGAILVLGLLLILHFRYKAIMILAVKNLLAKRQVEKDKIYAESDPQVSGLLKFGLVSLMFCVILIAFLSSPVVYLSGHDMATRAVLLGVFALLVCLPAFGVIYSAMIFGPNFMVVHYLSPWDSVRASIDVFRSNWLFLLGFWLVLLVVEIFGVMLSAGLMLVAVVPFVLLDQIFYDVGGSAGAVALKALAITLGFVVFLLSQAMVAAIQKIAWTIMFFEIVRPVKAPQAEDPETIPEVIS